MKVLDEYGFFYDLNTSVKSRKKGANRLSVHFYHNVQKHQHISHIKCLTPQSQVPIKHLTPQS